MALGFFLTEHVAWSSSDGSQLNVGTWEMKVPAAHDIPLSLNVSFTTPGTPNASAINVLGSKASGEPPMALGAAIALATRDAIRAARGRGKAKSLFPDLRDALQRQLRATTVAASMIASNGTKIKLHG